VNPAPVRRLVHVGLPKTATTMLQTDVFPVLPDRQYVGVRQPRHAGQDLLYAALRTATTAGTPGDLELARRRWSDCPPTTILSEEMLTVSEPEASWRDKLRWLSSIVADTPTDILVTVRDPVEGLFSYHVERRKQSAWASTRFMDAVANDEALHIFRYADLLAELRLHFSGNRLLFVRFEDLTTNLTVALGAVGIHVPDAVTPTARNVRAKTSEHATTGQRPTVRTTVRQAAQRVPTWARPGPRRRRLLGKLTGPLDRLRMPEKKVPRPTEQEALHLRATLRPHVQALLDATGLRYQGYD